MSASEVTDLGPERGLHAEDRLGRYARDVRARIPVVRLSHVDQAGPVVPDRGVRGVLHVQVGVVAGEMISRAPLRRPSAVAGVFAGSCPTTGGPGRRGAAAGASWCQPTTVLPRSATMRWTRSTKPV